MPDGDKAIKGDRFTTSDGVVLVVVDRLQKKQTAGYWVTNTSYKGLVQVMPSRTWTRTDRAQTPLAWVISSMGTLFQDKVHNPWMEGLLSLCAVSELDDQENEFGPIVP